MLEVRDNYDILGCGAIVCHGLGDPDQDPLEMVKRLLKTPVRYTFYVISELQPKRLNRNPSGLKLKKYIEKHGLGPMIETEGRHFSEINEKGFIKMWAWRPDYKSETFKLWCTENKVVPCRKMW